MRSNESDRNLTALSGRGRRPAKSIAPHVPSGDQAGAPPSKDVKQVRKVVAAKFGKVLHVSASHDWALCTAYQDESDLSVVLHRTAAGWTIATHDGGAFDAETLKKLGVPPADIAPLLKAYQ
jgi:hypothetical protein